MMILKDLLMHQKPRGLNGSTRAKKQGDSDDRYKNQIGFLSKIKGLLLALNISRSCWCEKC